MRNGGGWKSGAAVRAAALAFLVSGGMGWAANVDPARKQAWSENAGWLNFGPSEGSGLVVNDTFLSGYAWAENLGWIKLGASAGGPYANTKSDDWGVNLKPDGRLEGFAWSENAGWIRFDPSFSPVTLDRGTGLFDGYAWSENVGYVHFQNAAPAYSLRTTKRLTAGTMILIQ